MGDLHGNAPDSSPVALLIVDVINDLEFPGGDEIAAAALPMARALTLLAGRARRAGVPIVYANDNFGRWRSDFPAQLRHCLDQPVRGRPIVELLRPEQADYFVLKPKHSAFYATPLELLFHHLGVRRVIIAGMATESCVLFTAGDAFLRDYDLVVPLDCVASARAEDQERALAQMRIVLKADTRPSRDVALSGTDFARG